MPFKLPQPKSICTELDEAIRAHAGDNVTVGELMHSMHEKGFALIMMVFVLPNCVPIPVPPGVSTIFSIPLLFFSIQMLIGYPLPWLPKWLKNKKMETAFLLKVLAVITPKIQRIERILKPRFSFTASKTGERIVGFFWLIFSVSIAVPLPMTNFVPGIGLLISALGVLSRDGYVVIAGLITGLLGVAFTTAVLTWGAHEALALIGM